MNRFVYVLVYASCALMIYIWCAYVMHDVGVFRDTMMIYIFVELATIYEKLDKKVSK